MLKSKLCINGIVPESVVDGPGIRYTIFVQGCPHHCPGCHNPQTHDFNGGHFVPLQDILDQIKENPLLAGVTFSGGEPFCQAGLLACLGKEIHKMGLNVMTYTGYLYEDLLTKSEADEGIAALLKETDTLVDGPFILEQRDLTLQFRGSSNQRILHLKDGKVVDN